MKKYVYNGTSYVPEIPEGELALWNAQNVLGAKNLLVFPYSASSANYGGVAFTALGDGSIGVEGTSTDYSHLELLARTSDKGKLLKAGQYIVSMLTKDSNVQNIDIPNLDMIVRLYDVSQPAFIDPPLATLTSSMGRTASFELTEDMYNKIQNGEYQLNIRLYVKASGVVVPSGTKVFPMISLASDPDDTWTPYAPSNKDLYDMVRALQSGNASLNANRGGGESEENSDS